MAFVKKYADGTTVKLRNNPNAYRAAQAKQTRKYPVEVAKIYRQWMALKTEMGADAANAWLGSRGCFSYCA